MNRIAALLVVVLGLTISACDNANEETESKSDNKPEKAGNTDTHETEPVLNIDSLVTAINSTRTTIESGIGEPLAVKTTDLREKIKQKWQKIDFYAINGELARIKTHPYEQISKRTEEFYLHNGNLVLVIIEDNGDSEKEEVETDINKRYYFHNNELLKEEHSESEKEYSVRNSDAEELLVEFREYLDIYAANKDK